MHPTQHSTIHRKGNASMPPPPWPRAKDASTLNPTVQQQRITRLVAEAAQTLGGLSTPPKRLRVLNLNEAA